MSSVLAALEKLWCGCQEEEREKELDVRKVAGRRKERDAGF